MNRIRGIVVGVVMAALLLYGGVLAYKWGAMRVYVDHDEALMVISKFGKALPGDRIAVPADGYGTYKGVHEEVLGPGRYFINPVAYDTKTIPLVQIPAGDPTKWEFTPDGKLTDPKTAPMIGLVTAKQGQTPPPGQEVVEAQYKGLQREVLTPGTYKINTHLFDVQQVPAVVVPAGSVGVVTRLFGDGQAEVVSATLTEIRDSTSGPTTQNIGEQPARAVPSRLVAGENQRGILKDVLQPGIYYLNPRMYKVDIVPIGYDEITLEQPKDQIRFYSFDGYLVEADITVVWGISPADAPIVIATIGDWDLVRTNVIEPAMKAVCQNLGAKYTAKALIQGETRTQFQFALQDSLDKQVASRNIHVLLALIRNISIKDASGKDQTDGLLATIQRANIEIERELTNNQKTETARKKAELEQALKLVDLARETVASDSKLKVANINAEAAKKAAEIEAQRDLDVAATELQIAQLDAQRTLISGKAGAEVERLKRDAEAKGAKMLIDAFGSPMAYNQYIFANAFQPTELRLIFAGPGTFWTDLKSFQDVAGSQMIQQEQPPMPIPAIPQRQANPPKGRN